jgi:hypothetical protein
LWLLTAAALFSALVTGMPATGQTLASNSERAFPASTILPESAQATSTHPSLVLNVTRRDCGEVFAGEELDYPFYIANVGKAALELQPRSLNSQSANWWIPSSGAQTIIPVGYQTAPSIARLAAPS